jgi:hypothetical protein
MSAGTRLASFGGIPEVAYGQRGRAEGGFPYMVQARFTREGKDAVPADQVELTSASQTVTLWLPKGEYVVTIRDRAGAEARVGHN